ncbi:FAST kinase domain-containing protein 4 [Vespa crabro]|uniref:FAST kinase domain-containing protein 4 n=1 Tax=Vespa crabro TaxID=7445 RepID=UPI001F0008BA|nr:FAST kinase domain-containing protein 4 [Vespa crabro]
MLSLNSNWFNNAVRTFPYWRLSSLLSTNVVSPETSNITKLDDNVSQDDQKFIKKGEVLKNERIQQTKESQTSTPVNIFKENIISNDSLNEQISQAKNAKDLISLMNNPNITSNHVKEILHQISNIKIDVKEKDISNLINKSNENLKEIYDKKIKFSNNSGFLSLATPKLIQILKKLSYTNNRNIPLLKALSLNIALYSDQLNIRMCGDILYSLAILNYPEESLLEKIMSTLLKEIDRNDYGSIVSSIVNSIRLLKYKNHEVLDNIFMWANNNIEKLRFQDFTAILKCLATFGYIPKNMDNLQVYINTLSQKNTSSNKELWLDYVWSLTILNRVTTEHVSSVLNKNFVESILSESTNQNIIRTLKLLNINAAAYNILKDYNGPYLEDKNDVFSIVIENKKQKQELIDMLDETLQEIAPSCFQMNINTKMGFNIDAECCLNSKNKFVKYNDENLNNSTNTRLAIMVNSYHDYSRGEEDILGIVNFYNNILNAQGYKVLNVPYQNFSVNDILLKRIKYLNDQINSVKISAM